MTAVPSANPDILVERASMSLAEGRLSEAVSWLEAALVAKPDHVGALTCLGRAQRRAGRPEEAIAALERVLAAEPDDAAARTELALCFADSERSNSAADQLLKVLKFTPTYAPARVALARLYLDSGRPDEARGEALRALDDAPKLADGYALLGAIERAAGDCKAAEAHLLEAMRLSPRDPAPRIALGDVLIDEDRTQAAIECFRRALALDPHHAVAKSRLKAFGAAAKAKDVEPESDDTPAPVAPPQPGFVAAPPSTSRAAARPAPRGGGAHELLATGLFGKGWRAWLDREVAPGDAFRRELPETLHGQRVLVDCDGTMGEQLLFLRFAPELRRRGAWLACRPDPRIASLLGRTGLFDQIAGPSQSLESIDLRLLSGDLPHLLGHDESMEVPATLPLRAVNQRQFELQTRLTRLGPRPYIGVGWRSGREDAAVPGRAPPDRLGRLLSPLAATVIVLEPEASDDDHEAFASGLGRKPHDLDEMMDDTEDLLALTGLLDHHLATTGAAVHLRAGQGRVSHVLLPEPCDFYWMSDGSVSPWFPLALLYRQSEDGGWDKALAALAQDLAAARQG